MANVWFDDFLKCRSGKVVPYYDRASVSDDEIFDKKLIWFHEGYGRMVLYRVHQVDDTDDYIAESMRKSTYTGSDNWKLWSDNPELALV